MLLGIRPTSVEIVRATVREATDRPGFVAIFVATPRQVGADRGYTGWCRSDLVE